MEEDVPFQIDPEEVPVGETDENRPALDALRSVIDPELGINIVDLGLVYAVEKDDSHLGVAITMTTPACPMASFLLDDAERALRDRYEQKDEERTVEVYLVWEPPWQPEFMSEEAREMLGVIPRR